VATPSSVLALKQGVEPVEDRHPVGTPLFEQEHFDQLLIIEFGEEGKDIGHA
jgi:hypothetical protein